MNLCREGQCDDGVSQFLSRTGYVNVCEYLLPGLICLLISQTPNHLILLGIQCSAMFSIIGRNLWCY